MKMMTMFYTRCLIFCLCCLSFISIPVQAMEADSTDKEVIQFSGTMVYVELEGGFYGIKSDSGQHYLPVTLDDAFAQEGLEVKVRASTLPRQMGFRSWGRLIDIISIRSTSDCHKETENTENDE